jgi:hypothetical protein
MKTHPDSLKTRERSSLRRMVGRLYGWTAAQPKRRGWWLAGWKGGYIDLVEIVENDLHDLVVRAPLRFAQYTLLHPKFGCALGMRRWAGPLSKRDCALLAETPPNGAAEQRGGSNE